MKAVLKYGSVGLAAGAVLVCATMPWKLRDSFARAAIEDQIEALTGLKVRIDGGATLKLFPRPRLQLSKVSLSHRSGAVSADIPSVRGDLDVIGLLGGRLRIVSARLVEPTVVVDLDRGTEALRAVADRVRVAATSPGSAFRLSARNGLVRTLSHSPRADTLLTGVDLDLDQAAFGGRLTVSGGLGWHSATAQFMGSIERAAALFSGENSAATLQVDSSLGGISASGVLSGTEDRQFAGRLAGVVTALPRVFETFGSTAPASGIRRASLKADALLKVDDLSLSNLQLRLDGTQFEGTLALHGDGERRLIEGTLASDRIDLNALAGEIANPASLGARYRKPIDRTVVGADLDVDLRLSAGSASMGPLEVQDAALSALLRNDRLEVTLDEARAYDGLIRAHALATFDPKGWATHGDFSVADVEIGPLTKAVSGEEHATGTLSGHVALDGRGASPSEIVATLGGQGQASVTNGKFPGLSLQQALRRYGRKLPLGAKLPGQITTFDTASSTFAVRKGLATITDGRVVGPGLLVSFGGETDLPRGQVDIRAVATQTDAGGGVVTDAPRLPFAMRGSWNTSLAFVQSGGGSLNIPGGVPGFGSGFLVP